MMFLFTLAERRYQRATRMKPGRRQTAKMTRRVAMMRKRTRPTMTERGFMAVGTRVSVKVCTVRY